jgi:hypothetical protein
MTENTGNEIEPDDEDYQAVRNTPREPDETDRDYAARRYNLAQANKLIRLYGKPAP